MAANVLTHCGPVTKYGDIGVNKGMMTDGAKPFRPDRNTLFSTTKLCLSELSAHIHPLGRSEDSILIKITSHHLNQS